MGAVYNIFRQVYIIDLEFKTKNNLHLVNNIEVGCRQNYI